MAPSLSPPPRERSKSPTEKDERYILDGFWKHGRYYGAWKPGKYIFPIDSEELERQDIFHKFFLVAQNEAITSVKFRSDRNPRVMDLGTGTAIWAINVIDEVPGAEVLAVDLNKIQPPLIPRGLTPMQFDIEEPTWDKLYRDCDLIHMRLLLGSIRTDLWPAVYENIFEHLTPGHGHIEQTEIDWTPHWDEEGDIPSPSRIREWSRKYLECMDSCERTARVNPEWTKRLLEDAGFVDVKMKPRKVYLNPWSLEEDTRETARWFNLGICQALEAMSLMSMIDHGGMQFDEVRELCLETQKEMCSLRYRTHMTLYSWTARRPAGT